MNLKNSPHLIKGLKCIAVAVSVAFLFMLVIANVKRVKKHFKPTINLKPTIKVAAINNCIKGNNVGIVGSILMYRYGVQIVDYATQNYDVLVSCVYGEETIKDKKGVKIFYTGEAAHPKLNDYDLVIGFSRIKSSNYFRFPYYYGFVNQINGVESTVRNSYKTCPIKKKYFACFLVSNAGKEVNPYIGNGKLLDGAVARTSIFQKLSSYKRVESGGRHLNNIGRVIPNTYPESQEWLSQCKFTIAYENQSFDGYITEKVFNAYFAGTIPIYYGSRDAVTDINKRAIIYAQDFKDEYSLIEYIKKVDNDDKLYCDIWNQPIMTQKQKEYANSLYPELQRKIFEIVDRRLQKHG